MTARLCGVAALAAVLGALVNGDTVATIDSYPANVTWEITVENVNPTEPSTALAVTDPMLEGRGFSFTPAAPLTLGVEDQTSASFTMTISGYDDCVNLASELGEAHDDVGAQPVDLDNVVTVTWDLGSAQCTARLICIPPGSPSPGTTGATRTMGFFKTHEDALTQCLAQGDVDLGFITISSLQSALGLLWGSPSRFPDKTRREGVDQARFLLARQTLTAICNLRLFGTTPTPSDLIDSAVAALAGTTCASMLDLEGQVDAFNNSGDASAFPDGFDPGPATPKDAQDQAVDPTTPSGQVCE